MYCSLLLLLQNNQVSMVIILPDEIDGLAALTNQLDVISEACNTRLSQTDDREVKLYLPKFKVESELNLKDALVNKVRRSVTWTIDYYAMKMWCNNINTQYFLL